MKNVLLVCLLLAGWVHHVQTNVDLRTSEIYKGCDSIHEAHFEGVCSSSWAITVASVATDVICAFEKVKKPDTYNNLRISYQNIMECCSACYKGYENGCYGGNFYKAMEFVRDTGSVDGTGHPESYPKLANTFCKNYKLKICYQNPAYKRQCTEEDFSYTSAVGICNKKCDNSVNYDTNNYKISKIVEVEKGATYLTMALAMQGAIDQNKILITEITVFEDIYSFQKGQIYVHLYGRSIGTLTVAILGYGKDNITNQEFWLVRFPWGPEFGDTGFVKIQRGTNNSGIENEKNVYYLTKE